MNRLKKGIIAAVLLGSVTIFTGCSVKETWDILMGNSKESKSESGSEAETFDPNAVKVDESVEAPKFDTDLSGNVTYAVGEDAKPLKVEASVQEAGKITYQWYVNTVESNGGGAKIEGATANEYKPPTTDEGYYYYFVVATNTIDKKINLATSQIATIHVDPKAEPAPKEGELQKGWSQDDKGWYYVNKDGKKLTKKLKKIDDKTYYFNKKGYMVTGWLELKKKWYYFKEDGSMATGFLELDGKKYFMNDKGVMNTGWLDGGGSWYYSKDNGALAISEWQQIDNAWYYFNEDGVMMSNCEVNGKWLNPDGKLAE